MIVFLLFMSDKKLFSVRRNLDIKTLIYKFVNRCSNPNCHKLKIELIDFDREENRMNWDNELGPAISHGYVECNEWNYRLFPLSLFSFQNAKLRKRRVENFVDQYL